MFGVLATLKYRNNGLITASLRLLMSMMLAMAHFGIAFTMKNYYMRYASIINAVGFAEHSQLNESL